MFNNDVVGRTLDKIAKYGTEQLFMKVMLQVYKHYNLNK